MHRGYCGGERFALIKEEKMEEVRQENKMGTMSEGKLLLNMSLPMMVSMLVQAM